MPFHASLFLPKQPRFLANMRSINLVSKRVWATQISLYPSDAVIEYYLANSGVKQDSYLKLLGVTRN